ncbi:MAG: CopG family transcriptional regulator [Haloplanus sp.]
MEGEQSEVFPSELRAWVERKAAERDAEPAAILARAAAVYRLLDAEADGLVAPLDDLTADVDALADRVDVVEDELDYKIDDVRDRVVQIKRETDAKAPRDHGHPDLDDRVNAAVRAASDAESAVADLETRLDRGFENYEEILEHLTDATDELDENVETLAGAVVDIRAEARRVSAAEHDRRAVDDLRTAANRHGERTASCADCSATVDLGLLARPNCPHCEAAFVDFEPATGFFSSATLSTGDRPALTDGRDDALGDVADLFDVEASTDD